MIQLKIRKGHKADGGEINYCMIIMAISLKQLMSWKKSFKYNSRNKIIEKLDQMEILQNIYDKRII